MPINKQLSECPPGNWYPRRKLTPEEVIENIKRIIREERRWDGYNLNNERDRERITSRMERDLFLMKKLEVGKLKRAARSRLEYRRFTRDELTQLYNEIKLIK